MQVALLQKLSRWQGRGAVQSAFELRGFSLPRIWQERMIQFCGLENAVELNRYWDEVAAETISSAGKGDPKQRKFLVEPGYRSSYLDELAAKMNFAEPPFRYPPLLKGLHEYLKKYSDRTFAPKESAFFESIKEPEIAKFSISSSGWTGRKRGLVPYAKQLGELRGYVRKRGRFVKKSPAGLTFEFKVDAGGNPDCTASLPLQFYIYHSDEPDFVYEATLFDRIVPGFDRYAYCGSPNSFVLGVLAHIEFFDVLYHSFPEG
jgi:hypothetical protein